MKLASIYMGQGLWRDAIGVMLRVYHALCTNRANTQRLLADPKSNEGTVLI
jgi:hypothetical protein